MNILAAFTGQNQFEPQMRAPKQRMCGAATLAMAYRKCGLNASQEEIWKSVAHCYNGYYRAHTHHLAQDAIARGLSAAIIQTHKPWETLEACWRNNISVVVNHRLNHDSNEGHYSLFAGFREDQVRLHDPLLGPNVEMTREQMQKLWLPSSPDSEIAGNVLIAISDRDSEPAVWSHCNQIFEDAVVCSNCNHNVSLKPVHSLGCTQENCKQRLWWRIFCPSCDHPIQSLAIGN
ncbi:MAG: C39 family peptidase [Mariniblastus sp.]